MKLFKLKHASKKKLVTEGDEPGLTFAEQMMAGREGRNSRNYAQISASIKAETHEDIIAELGDIDLSEEEVSEELSELPKPLTNEKKTVSFGPRRITPSVVNLYGIDRTSEDVFMKTMGMDSGKEVGQIVKSRRNLFENVNTDAADEEDVMESASNDPYNIPFESSFGPDEMRCLALVAHNHMKPAMKEFVKSHQEVLKKFRLTGTNTTMTMLRDTFGNDPSVKYGPSFNSGPLGGDAELCALMCLEDLGGVFFFMDPLSAHPHQADIESLVRLTNVHNILTCCNPCSAHAMCFVLKCALEGGRKDKIPSFFTTLKSPGVAVYKEEQRKALEDAKKA